MKINKLIIITALLISCAPLNALADEEITEPYRSGFCIKIKNDEAFNSGLKCNLYINYVYEINNEMYYPLRYVAEALGMGVEWNDSDKSVCISTETEELFPYWEKDTFFYGYMNIDGETVLEPKYTSGTSFCEDLAYVSFEGSNKYGYINRKGEIVIPCIYDRAKNFVDGVALVCTDYRTTNDSDWIFIDKTGKQVIDKVYKEGYVSSFYDGYSVYIKDGYPEPWLWKTCVYIDKTGEPVNDMEFEDATDFHDGYAAVKNNGKWAVIDKDFNYRTEQKYDMSSDALMAFMTQKRYKTEPKIESNGEQIELKNDVYIINDNIYVSVNDLSAILGERIERTEQDDLLVNSAQ